MVKSTILSAWGTFHEEKVHPASETLAIIFVFKKIFILTGNCYEIERYKCNSRGRSKYKYNGICNIILK